MEPYDSQGRTLLHCPNPNCRKPTFTYIAHGDISVWCRHCKKAFEVLIKPSNSADETKRPAESHSAEGGD